MNELADRPDARSWKGQRSAPFATVGATSRSSPPPGRARPRWSLSEWPTCWPRGGPPGIVAFTFTQRAAEELAQRIARRVEARLGTATLDHLGGLYVGTIHGYCFRLLQQRVPATRPTTSSTRTS